MRWNTRRQKRPVQWEIFSTILGMPLTQDFRCVVICLQVGYFVCVYVFVWVPAHVHACERERRGEAELQRIRVHHQHHLSLNHEGRWGTTDDFATSFLHFPLFSTALWDLANSRPVHSQMLSSHLFFHLPCLLPPFTVPCKMVLVRPDKWETCLHTTSGYIS